MGRWRQARYGGFGFPRLPPSAPGPILAPHRPSPKGPQPVSHDKHIVTCSGPHDAHAFDGIPVRFRTGDLDKVCPLCGGHGQWNTEFNLATHRSKRCICPKCDGRGWIETGDDPVPSPAIVMSPEGYPQWVVRLDPSDDKE